MNLNSYTIFDSCSGSYSRPFFTAADGDAVRQFGDIANDESHPIGKHPEHYSLFRNGTFNDQTGKFNPEEVTHLANAHEAVSQHQRGVDIKDLSPGLTD